MRLYITIGSGGEVVENDEDIASEIEGQVVSVGSGGISQRERGGEGGRRGKDLKTNI